METQPNIEFSLHRPFLGQLWLLQRDIVVLMGLVGVALFILVGLRVVSDSGVTEATMITWAVSFLCHAFVSLCAFIFASMEDSARLGAIQSLISTSFRTPFVVVATLYLGVSLGLSFWILPGVIILSTFGTAPIFALRKGTSPVNAFEQSAQNTKPYRGSIFCVNLMMTAICAILAVSSVRMLNPSATSDVMLHAVSEGLSLIFAILFVYLQGAVYREITYVSEERNDDARPD